MPYGKNKKKKLLEMTKCNGTKFLPHNSISLTFWTIFFTENIGYPFNIFPLIGTWGTKYLNSPTSKFYWRNYQYIFLFAQFTLISTFHLVTQGVRLKLAEKISVLRTFGTFIQSNVEIIFSWTCHLSRLLNFEHPWVLLICLLIKLVHGRIQNVTISFQFRPKK